MMEDNDEEEDDYIPDWIQGGAFVDALEGETEEEMGEAEGPIDDLGQVLRDAKEECENVKELKKFEHMLDDHKKLLYPDYKQGYKKWGTTLEMLQWKAKNGASKKGFDELMKIIKNMLPKGNELPSSMYE